MTNIVGRGALIVLEGCDHAGKTSQAKSLVASLIKCGKKAEYMNFPDRTSLIGTMINSYLKNTAEMDDHAIHLLFSANRWESVSNIRKLLREGTTLIIDRYAYSGVAFSAAKKNLTLEWCKSCDIGLPKPDLVLFLELSAETAAERSSFGEERYENKNFQEEVHNMFLKLKDDTWKVINADRDRDSIFNDLNAYVLQAIEASESCSIGKLWTN